MEYGKWLAFSLLILYTLGSCKKEEIAKSQVTPTSMGQCFSEKIKQAFLVQNDKEYEKLAILLRNENVECDNIDPPTIDFDEYSLLGVFASGSGCTVDYDRVLYKQEGLVNYTYEVTINMAGNCNMYSSSMNWVLVPKILDKHSVDFCVKQCSDHREDCSTKNVNQQMLK